MSSQLASNRGLLGRAARAFSRTPSTEPTGPPPAYHEVTTRQPESLMQGCREAMQRLGSSERNHFGITSSIRGEGRSSVAAGMAVVSAFDLERRTVLIDLDLERPAQHIGFGIGDVLGINDLVDGYTTLEDYLHPLGRDLWLVSAGRPRGDASRALNRLVQSGLLPQARGWAETLVFDLPPLFDSSIGPMAARVAHQPVLVVRAGATTLPQVSRAVEMFHEPPAIILNGVRSSLPRWVLRSLGEWT